MGNKKQNRLKKQETRKRNELGLLSRQLQRFENASPGSVSDPTKLVLGDLKPDVKHFEDQSEETTPYPSEWPQKKGLVQAERKLSALWLELYHRPEDPQSPQASSSGDGQNQHEPEHQEKNAHAVNGPGSRENDAHQGPDEDIDMRSNPGTSEEHRANSASSEDRTNSSSSRENSASTEPASEDTANSSHSRESSASTEPEANHWPLFNSKVKDWKRWIPIKSECRLYGCDFADISFRCEVYCQLENPGSSESQLLDLARMFMVKCPAALESLSEMCEESEISYRKYRSTHPRQSLSICINGERDRYNRQASVFSDDLDRDRRERGFGRPLRAPAEDWQDIVLVRDPDTNKPGEIRGKIQMIIGKWIDISLPSLNPDNPDKERHALVRRADYREKADQFEESPEGNPRCFKLGQGASSLTGFLRSEVNLHYYTLARQTYMDRWPDGYAVGYADAGIVPWRRGEFADKFGKADINQEINDQRLEVGQEPIVTISRPRVRC